jgi:hypothetical protein
MLILARACPARFSIGHQLGDPTSATVGAQGAWHQPAPSGGSDYRKTPKSGSPGSEPARPLLRLTTPPGSRGKRNAERRSESPAKTRRWPTTSPGPLATLRAAGQPRKKRRLRPVGKTSVPEPPPRPWFGPKGCYADIENVRRSRQPSCTTPTAARWVAAQENVGGSEA